MKILGYLKVIISIVLFYYFARVGGWRMMLGLFMGLVIMAYLITANNPLFLLMQDYIKGANNEHGKEDKKTEIVEPETKKEITLKNSKT